MNPRAIPSAGAAMRRSAAPIALALALLGTPPARPAGAQEFTPPPEAGDGDYEVERTDSLADGVYETTYAANGSVRSAPRRSQRLRFRGGGTAGSLREGDDALAGGRLEAPLARGTLRVGRLAPRWNRGLLLGAPAEVWSEVAPERGELAALRGRAGEGAAWEAGERLAVLSGRFSRRTLHAARASAGPFTFAGVGGPAGRQASAGVGFAGSGHELAMDARGNWRAESVWNAAEGPLALRVLVRAGTSGYQSLAEPRRTGPSRALAASARGGTGRNEARGLFALWRYAPGAPGYRGFLEVHRSLVQHADVFVGFEEHRGWRRVPGSSAAAAAAVGMRQGTWCEWRAASPRGRLALRHEWWAGRPWLRSVVRRVSIVNVQAALPADMLLSVAHAAWRVRRGERAYVLETDADRLVLRALSGAGTRTRCELDAPVLGGRARLGIAISGGDGRDVAPRWTAEWTRRARLEARHGGPR